MNNMILNYIIINLLITPNSIIIHDIALLLGAKHLKADRIVISIGSGKKIFSYNFNEMSIKSYLMIMFQAHTHSERQPKFNNKELAFITAMGPLFSLILTVFLGLLLCVITSEIIIYFFLFNLWLTITNLIPFKFKNQMS